MDTERREQQAHPVECVVALLWPQGAEAPMCEMFLVDHLRRVWRSKHFSGGVTFDDGGRLLEGETARALALVGTRSARHRYGPRTCVTFALADLDPSRFDSTAPTEWTLDSLRRLPNADLETWVPQSSDSRH